MTSSADPFLVVVGPTASGKTALAVRLAEALGGEIISADSVQVYRHFDIGTGKPTEEQQRVAPHHFVDILDPLEPMDAARWASAADSAIAGIRAKGKVPIVCGGTYLWVRALLFGLAGAPAGNEDIRARHRAFVEAYGRAALHAELAKVDPVSAAKLAENDLVRVSRALEVTELTGRPMSAWQAEHGFRSRRYEARLIGVRHAPEALAERIRERVAQMLAAGWVNEVEWLVDAGYAEARAMKSVGYRQIFEVLKEGGIDAAELFRRIERATRIFARRQRTWLRDAPVEWLDPAEAQRFLP